MSKATSRLLNAVSAIARNRGHYDLAAYTEQAAECIEEGSLGEVESLADKLEAALNENRDPEELVSSLPFDEVEEVI